MDIVQPTCPWCGKLPDIIISDAQAFCSNPECVTVCWNPSRTAVQNLADVGVVDIEGFLGREPG